MLPRITLTLVLINACAWDAPSTGKSGKPIWDIADEYILDGDYEAAWGILKRTPVGMTQRTVDYLHRNPKVFEAAKKSFSRSGLLDSKARGMTGRRIYADLDSFARFSSKSDYSVAANNVEAIFGTSVDAGAIGTQQGPQAPRYGRVVDVQIANESRINNNSGAALGSIVGQAAYLDNSTWQSYSVLGQVGAAIAGATIGSAADQPTQIRYKLSYWIRLNDAETIKIAQHGDSQTHIPEATCVKVSGLILEAVNASQCNR